MAEYRQFNPQDAMEFANLHSDLFGEHSKLSCHSFGDGHMNQVFRVQSQTGSSLIVKQGLPFARGLSNHWPLSLDRRRIEAQTLRLFAAVAPDFVVEVLHYDADQAAILLEDLEQLTMLDLALLQGRQFQQLGQQLGEFLAHTAVAYSDLMSALPQQRARQLQFSNPEPWQITEDLLFNDPYCHHERNEVPAALRVQVQQLWYDEALLAQVAALKACFRSQADTLVHGDFSSQSVFASPRGLKVIDAEFAGYGPHGFDLGIMLGSLIMHYLAASYAPPPHSGFSQAQTKDQQNYLFNQIKALLQSYPRVWLAQAGQCRDGLFSNPLFHREQLLKALQHAIGFAGCEIIRRVYGAFPAACLQQLPAKERLATQTSCLQLAQRLILHYRQIQQSETLLAWLQDQAN